MIYIFVALPDELPNSHLDEKKYKVIFTGFGKVNAAFHATRVAARADCDTIINYGSAGVLRKNLAGKLSLVDIVRQRDMDARPISDLGITPFDPVPLAGDIKLTRNEEIVLSTGDNFVTKKPELESDLVDMEAYAIAKVAISYSRQIKVLKYGSDFADEDAMENWSKNCSDGQELFLDWLRKNT